MAGLSLHIHMVVIAMAHKKLKKAPGSFLSPRNCRTKNVCTSGTRGCSTCVHYNPIKKRMGRVSMNLPKMFLTEIKNKIV